MDISSLSRLDGRCTRSICAENPTGEKGRGGTATLENGIAARAARDLGTGWKVDPYIVLKPRETRVIADISGSGEINHIWITPSGR